jgi:cyclic pyranopterin phosphate synthase
MTRVLDQLGRPLGALRLSVTDRCNLRCRYCMPAASYQWLTPDTLLSLDELARVARIFVGLGVTKLRVTGGEPLLRQGLVDLIRELALLPGVTDLALTTNGTMLARYAADLKAAGLHRITVSLDTLQAEKMKALTRRDQLSAVQDGLGAANQAGFEGLKLNTVVMRGTNDDELAELVNYAAGLGIEARFIEYMDVGGASDWNAATVVPASEIVSRLEQKFGAAVAMPRRDPAAPASRWRFADGQIVGIVASTTQPFCRDCDRMRITADGMTYRCLYAADGVDLRAPLREGANDTFLSALIRDTWQARTDRGAEQRLKIIDRQVLVPLERLRAEPRLEMHVRGG